MDGRWKYGSSICFEHLSGIWSCWFGARVWSLSVPSFPLYRTEIGIELLAGRRSCVLNASSDYHCSPPIACSWYIWKKVFAPGPPNMMPGYFQEKCGRPHAQSSVIFWVCLLILRGLGVTLEFFPHCKNRRIWQLLNVCGHHNCN